MWSIQNEKLDTIVKERRAFYSICTMSRCEVQLIRAEPMKDIYADRDCGLEDKDQYSKQWFGSRGHTVSRCSSRIYDFVVICDVIDELVVSDGLFLAGRCQDLVFLCLRSWKYEAFLSFQLRYICQMCAVYFSLKTDIYTKHESTSQSRVLYCV